MRNRRGGVYVLALAAAALVSVIGLGAMSAARVDGASARLEVDAHKAAALARSGMEVALAELADTADWRAANTGQWTQRVIDGQSKWAWRLDDLDDGRLGEGSDRNVRLTCRAVVGQAMRMVSVQVDSASDGAPAIRPGSYRDRVDLPL
ncbi:MAG: hypothetical protein AAF288_05425 [Planctomycetota bacterium]